MDPDILRNVAPNVSDTTQEGNHLKGLRPRKRQRRRTRKKAERGWVRGGKTTMGEYDGPPPRS